HQRAARESPRNDVGDAGRKRGPRAVFGVHFQQVAGGPNHDAAFGLAHRQSRVFDLEIENFTRGVGEVQRPLRGVFVKVSYASFGSVRVLARYVSAYVWDLAWLGVRKTHDEKRRAAVDVAGQHAELPPRSEVDVSIPTADQAQRGRRQVRALLG